MSFWEVAAAIAVGSVSIFSTFCIGYIVGNAKGTEDGIRRGIRSMVVAESDLQGGE